MRLACSLGPAWAELASCVNSSTERTCALFSLTFMALVNSLNGPKRAADYTFPHPRPECLKRVTSPINDTRAGCWVAQIIARRTAKAVTACPRGHAYLIARWARQTADPREPRAAAARRDGIGVLWRYLWRLGLRTTSNYVTFTTGGESAWLGRRT